MQTNVVMGLGNSGELRPSAKNRGGPCALPFARVCCHQFAIKNGVFFVSHHAFSCSVNWVKKSPETIGLATVSGLGGGWWIRIAFPISTEQFHIQKRYFTFRIIQIRYLSVHCFCTSRRKTRVNLWSEESRNSVSVFFWHTIKDLRLCCFECQLFGKTDQLALSFPSHYCKPLSR